MPANVNIVENKNGDVREFHLCSACAEEVTRRQLQSVFGGLLPPQLAGLFALDNEEEEQAAQPPQQGPACPRCGLTLHALEKEGRAGCAECYNAFAASLGPVINRVQAGPRHTGRKPVGYTPPARPAPDRRTQLQTQLKQAVEQENYEEAARLRDEIKSL